MVWVIIVVGAYLLILLGLAWISLHPYRIPIFLSPGGLGCSQEDVEFTSSDGITLRGWWVDACKTPPLQRNCTAGEVSERSHSPEGPRMSAEARHRGELGGGANAESLEPSAVAIVSHGYMMNRSELSPLAPLLASKGISSLYYDLRAHGRSAGRKSYLGYKERLDIAAAIEFARQRHPGCKIILIGSSMGAAASALAAGDDPSINGLVLDCSYSRLPSAVLGWWRFLGGKVLAAILSPTPILCMPLAGFNPYKVDIAEGLSKAGNVPVLFFHGDCDTLALPSEAKRNQEACKGPTKIVWMKNCGHAEGRWIHPELYNSELLSFIDQYVL